ncbi:MAG: penicillin-binding protein activator [Proteobacteria bacterium]|nr:penicillin-binding protein activator [Pseudomonadota bacterium]
MITIAKQCRAAAMLLAFVAMLSACATGDFYGTSASQGVPRAEREAGSGRYSDAAGTYIGLAALATGDEQTRLTLLAIEQWLYAGDARRARNALRAIPIPSAGELLWLWSADAAALRLWDGQPDEALSLLEPLSRRPLPQDHRARIEALRADAWFQKNEPVRAIELYLQREIWLDDEFSIRQNRRRLWAGLKVSDSQVLRDAAKSTYDKNIQGWLALGSLANATGEQGIGWGNGVVQWRQTYRDHPAIGILDEMDLPEAGALAFPRQIALLLPLSGNNAAAGKAIRNGFLGAYFSATAEIDDAQLIRLYDINGPGDALAAYDRAVRDGAEFVVGPLLRRSVSELAAESLLPVPVLALNYLPGDVLAPPGFYQFALAPEDEARSAASRTINDDLKRGVALVPNNDWGRRVLTSFTSEFEAAGGQLLDYRSYQPSDQDFSFEIQELLALSQSVQRYRRLRANIGGPLQFDPRRRQDVDFVFLAADAKAGRLIKSQLKFHYSGDLPVYSTSFIYSMDGRSDTDLDGVMFAETPWVVNPPAWIADFPELYAEYWPAEKRLTRLHAMGYDAYHLVGGLFPARTGPMDEIIGATGTLTLEADGRVHRRMAWARFERGKPELLPVVDEFQYLLDELGPDSFFNRQPEWRNPQPLP